MKRSVKKPAAVAGDAALTSSAKTKNRPPFPFVLDALAPLRPEVRRMFSGFAVYLDDRIVCMLRVHAKSPQDNGLWLVLAEGVDPADKSLRRDFPSLRKIELLGGKIGHWLLIPADGNDFEAEAERACEMLLRRDPRLGRVPQSRK